METLTFYSYKGGVGRTLLLSNIANYLSKFGFNVCILDFDLEAPGLHYKMNIQDQVKKGIVDFIVDFMEKDAVPSNMWDYAYNVPSQNSGKITLIPAGDTRSASYWKNLSKINWSSFLYEPEANGMLLFLQMKEYIKTQIKPDFLLIDSRTGVTEIGGICTVLLPEKVIFLLTNNQENMDGTSQVVHALMRTTRMKDMPIKTYFALTRIPYSVNNDKDRGGDMETEANIISKFKEQIENITPVIDNVFVIHSDRNLETREFIAVQDHKRSEESPVLLQDYLKLFSHIIDSSLIEPKLDEVINKILIASIDSPDEMELELENLVKNYKHQKTLEKLVSFYALRNVPEEKYINAFNDLIKYEQDIKWQLIKKYYSFFVKEHYSVFISLVTNKFNLSFIRKNLFSFEDLDFIEKTVRRLCEVYNGNKQYKQVISLIESCLERKMFLENKYIISVLIDSYSNEGLFSKIEGLYLSSNQTVQNSPSIKTKYLLALLELKKNLEVEIMILGDERLQEYLTFNYSEKALLIFEMVGHGLVDSMTERLAKALKEAMKKEDVDKMASIGRSYYRINKSKEFKEQIKNSRNMNAVMRRLE